MDKNNEPVQVKDKLIEPKLLALQPTQRCFVPECQAWCCTGGVWVDLGEKEKILANAERIKPFLPPDRHDTSQWFDGEQEPDDDYPSGWGEGTTVIDDPSHPAGTTCIFLRPEDRYCAIQSASMANGEHPWSLKPFYCVLHPLTLEDNVIQLDDTNVIYTEGGHCQRPNEVSVPMFETFKAELVFALGEDGYEELLQSVSQNPLSNAEDMPTIPPPNEFTCATCGSPIPTTAAPGDKAICNCCGAANVVPPLPSTETTQPGPAENR